MGMGRNYHGGVEVVNVGNGKRNGLMNNAKENLKVEMKHGKVIMKITKT